MIFNFDDYKAHVNISQISVMRKRENKLNSKKSSSRKSTTVKLWSTNESNEVMKKLGVKPSYTLS